MNFIRAFGRFWYDFLVGDDWKIPVAVLIALVLTFLLMTAGWFADSVLTALGAALIVLAFVVSVVVDLRNGRS